MMEWTDRHCRAFHRVLTKRSLLYTEMVSADAVRPGDRDRLIGFCDAEHPVALQLGGSDPTNLAEAARIGADYGYDEINLNCGCPSDRVQSGRFGACLMAEPGLVARSVEAMKRAVSVPVTVKCRLGIDDQDIEAGLSCFVRSINDAGVDAIIVHARKAWLQGLSPKDNRSVPPLDYDRVHRLKMEFPALWIGINGGIETLDAAEAHLMTVDGVMLGRAAYRNPSLLAGVDQRILGSDEQLIDPYQAVGDFLPYIEAALSRGERLNRMTRHMLGLFHGRPGAREWRRILTMESVKPGADITVVERALGAVTRVRDHRRSDTRPATAA